MARIITVFITLCMLVIAASVGVVAHWQFGIGLGEAGLLAIGAMLVAIMIRMDSGRRRDRRHVARRFDEVLDSFEATCDEVANLERRLTRLEEVTKPETANEVQPLIAEVEVLGALVKRMAEQVTDNETRIADLEEHARTQLAAPARMMMPPAVGAVATAEPVPPPPPAPERDATAVDEARAEAERRRLVETIRSALDHERIELHMQPIVTLPQRQVRFYEVLTRLVTEEGDHLYPDTFLEPAERAGLMPRIDGFMLQRATRILRRLTQRNRSIGVFCNLSGRSLLDGAFFKELMRFYELNPDLAGWMVVDLRQKTVQDMGPIELENLADLRELKCRFALEHVEDMHLDFAALSARGFRFVKIGAPVLMDEQSAARGDIHVADLADLAARHGIEIIANGIEAEQQVIRLLDYNIRYAQGELFAPPKAVRAEVLDAINEAPPGQARRARRGAPIAG